MNDNELNLEQLKSVYKAHTEAYLEFNLALINILTNQQEILSKVSDLKDLSDLFSLICHPLLLYPLQSLKNIWLVIY